MILLALTLLFPTAHAGDRDNDGIKNKDDLCREQAETVNGYLDLDGCPDELGTVTITVFDLDGTPLQGARVALGSERGLTDAEGSVVFADRTPTVRVDLAASMDGFVTTTLPEWEVREGPITEVVVLDWQATPVTVAVIDASSRKPLSANVRWDGPGLIATERTDAATGQATFDARPGTWRLQAQTDNYQLAERTIEVLREGNPTHGLSLVPNWMQIEERWVPFEPGSAELSASQEQSLDALATDLFGFPDVRIRLEGHADDADDALSATRAESVASGLVSAGVSSSRIDVVDAGEGTPVGSPWTAEGRTANRSVRLRWLGEDDPIGEVRIPFATDRATATGDLSERLAPVVQALADTPGARIAVTGHRDPSEGALSLIRATAVQDYLLSRDVPDDRLFAVGRRAVDDLDSGVAFRLRSGGETVDLPHEVFFEPGNALVLAVSVDPLRDAARLAKSHPVMRIAVRGHAAAETVEQSGPLATERARTIERFLIDSGVDAERISVRGFPEVGDETDITARRVDFVVLPPPLLSSERIVYDAAVADPDGVAEPVLRRVAEAMATYPVHVQISGTGVAADNAPADVLGRLRASKVQDALIALGVPRGRLITTGSESTGDAGLVTFRVTRVDAAQAVGFHAASAMLDADARGALSALVPSLLLTPDPVRVTGYASGADGRVMLSDLAEQRAKAVADYLVYSGVDGARVRSTIRVEPTGGPSDRRVDVRVGE